MARILIVEDDRMTAPALQRAVTRLGHTVVARTASAAEALAAVHAHGPDGDLLDRHVSRSRNGLFVAMDIQAVRSTFIIVLAASAAAHLGMPDGPGALWGYLAQPIDWHQLQDLLAWLFPTHPPCPRAPGSGLEDTPPPIRCPLQALRARLRHLRQSVGAF
jgi:CheY-like chemotaxis protein